MNDDDLRAALGSWAAAGAPRTDPRPGLGARLARRRRARRAAVAGIASVAALVAATGVASLGSGSGRALVVASDPTATPEGESPTPDAPATTPAAADPTTPPATTRPPTTPAPQPSSPAPTAAVAPVPATATASGEEGLRIEVTVAATNPATADLTEVTVRATDDDGHPQMARVTWGDGTGEAIGYMTPACAPHTPSPTHVKTPGSARQAYHHAWRRPGTYTVTVGVRSEVPCDMSVPGEYAEVRIVVRVRPGPDVTNGPAAPEARYPHGGAVTDGGPREMAAGAYLTDADGCVVDATLDWGDGTVVRLEQREEGCVDGGGAHYPKGDGIGWEERHTYAKPGRYVVTFRVTSAGLGGEDVQRATATMPLDAR